MAQRKTLNEVQVDVLRWISRLEVLRSRVRAWEEAGGLPVTTYQAASSRRMAYAAPKTITKPVELSRVGRLGDCATRVQTLLPIILRYPVAA